MADMMFGAPSGIGDLSEDNTSDYYGTSYGGGAAGAMNNNALQQRPRLPGLYVGNLTWWTTDQDVENAINSIGIDDIQEIKFFENRNNGQSKGFCVVTFNSEQSLPIVLDKLPKLELHGQNPVVTPYNRQNLSLFESQVKTRPPMNPSNGSAAPHAAGIMGINSISGVHAAQAAMQPYPGVNAYNQGPVGAGIPRNPSYHSNMRMQMRPPRAMMRGPMSGPMNNGPVLPGHQMNRMRFTIPQSWNNSQNAYNPSSARVPQNNMDISNRLSGGGLGVKQDDVGQDMLGNSGSQGYYSGGHHQNSQLDHNYRRDEPRDLRDRDSRDHRDSRELRDSRDLRDDRDSNSRRIDDRPSRLDDRSLRRESDRSSRDERHSRHDDRSERSSGRRDERSSRREEDPGRSRRGVGGGDERREERSSKKEEKSSSSSSRREKSHRTDDTRARSRSRSRERSRDKKERKDRKERY